MERSSNDQREETVVTHESGVDSQTDSKQFGIHHSVVRKRENIQDS